MHVRDCGRYGEVTYSPPARPSRNILQVARGVRRVCGMDTERNSALVRRFIDEVFVGRRADAIDELLSDDFVSHTLRLPEPGRAPLKAATERVHASLSDVVFDVEDVMADGDRVAVRLTATATPTGDFMGVPAAGKRYTIGEMHWFRIKDGLIAEHWHQHDALGMMKQLGALPA
jgi:steroid delta-isomerase-like uncharacterized protein